MGHVSNLEFRGSERFVVERKLGGGGMGIVYLARDTERGARVALKLLRKVDPVAIYRFKKEFRALADVTHPNLVTLYELVSQGDDWFFTMEVVDGVDFLTFVREGRKGFRSVPPRATSTPMPETTSLGQTQETASIVGSTPPISETDRGASAARRSLPPLSSTAQFDRLREGLRQLAEGMMTLHHAGHLHRDIKPSNVMVTREERVVLLDFGVVTELAKQRRDKADRLIIGTPAYMAPEQAAGKEVGAASDWYAVGVVLYEALTGQRPFVGTRSEVIEAKQRCDPPPPIESNGAAPRDLVELCNGLLAADPGERFSGEDILRALGAVPAGPRGLAAAAAAGEDGQLLIGRQRHLDQLSEAYEAVQGGAARTVFVSGRTGSGKTALCTHFLDSLRAGGEAVLLTGRCYEQESVPYKALDSLIDALTRHLLELPEEQVHSVMPRTVQALARLFPVLRRIEAVVDAPTSVLDTLDPQELRQRGFTALRRLLNRLAEQRPLVLYMDDLQWADTDSAAVLAEVLRPPEPPAMLLIVSFRSEDTESSAFLRAVRQTVPTEHGDNLPSSLVELTVGDLSFDDGRDLARALFEEAGVPSSPITERRSASIARETSGNPLFIHELVRFLCSADDSSEITVDKDVGLDDALRSRLRELPAPALRLLETVAVAGRPTSQGVVLEAADLAGDQAAALALLRTGHLVRTRGSRASDDIETYHDRIREVVVEQLDETALAERHRRLALALQYTPEGDPEMLAVHFEAAGDIERAGEYCETAAEQAAKALAFDRAAALYGRALELRLHYGGAGARGSNRTELCMRMGDALVNAGRGAEAADAYLAAAKGAPPMTRLECERRAAEQLLINGHIERGLEAIESLLGKIGAILPPTPRRALASLLWQRAKLRAHGLRWKERDEHAIPTSVLIRADVFKAVAFGLAMIDTIRATDFHTRNLLATMKAGEKNRIARALIFESGIVAAQGGRALGRARKIADQCVAFAETADDPYLTAGGKLADGIVAYFESRFRHSYDMLSEAERRFLEENTGVPTELSQARVFRQWGLLHTGSFAEMSRSYERLVLDARRRGDLFLETTLKRGSNVVSMAHGTPSEAYEILKHASWSHPEAGFHLQHWFELKAYAELALYERTTAAALDEGRLDFDGVARSTFKHIQFVRSESRWLHGRVLLAASESGREPKASLAHAATLARKLLGEHIGYATVWGLLLRAGVEMRRGAPSRAMETLAQAAEQADANDMCFCAASARRRRGEILGGEAGAELIATADAWMREQEIAEPARMVDVAAPGFRAPS